MASDTTSVPFLPLLGFFGDPEIAECFSLEASVESWLEVERALASVQASLGLIPPAGALLIEREATSDKIDLSRLRDQTQIVGYPILPLLEQVGGASPPDVGRYLHWGATTQDIMDTGLVLQMRQALSRTETLLFDLGDAVADQAREHRSTILAARTHGQQAVPTTFGAKLSVLLAELERHAYRLRAVRDRVIVVQMFGAAGTAAAYGQHSRTIRHRLADRLGIGRTEISWHTARDSLAEVAFVLAAIAASCGKIAREVIALSRSEICEVREAGGAFRGASSTMPQKANPIDSETIVGMSVLAAQQVSALLAAMQGTHERAAGEWQVEWDALPAAFGYACGALLGANRVVAGLRVFPERMRKNMDSDGGMIMSEAVMMAVAPELGRAHAHELVYQACVVARETGQSLGDALRQMVRDGTISLEIDVALSPDEYLGEAVSSVDLAIAQWAAARRSE